MLWLLACTAAPPGAPSLPPTPDTHDEGRPPDPSDEVFRDDHVLDVHIELPTESWNGLVADPRTEVPGAVTVDGARMDDVGVRLKGGAGSFLPLDPNLKASFIVDLNEYADHEYRGLTRMTLNNCVQDATWTHQELAYAVYREMGVAAPRTTWVRLTVNDEPFGLYAWVESVDRRFLERNFADDSGNLYETSYYVDFLPGHEPRFEVDQGDGDTSDVTAVIDALGRAPDDDGIAALEALVDLDDVMRGAAVEAVILHWDGLALPNNVRYYHDPSTGRFVHIPWGTDQTFMDDLVGPYDSSSRLVRYCLANPACLDRYDALLLEAADAMEGLDLIGRLHAYEALLAADIAADPRAHLLPGEYEADMALTEQQIRAMPDQIRRLVDERE